MIEDVFNTENFEWQGDKENVVRRITTLDYMESMAKINPRRVEKLPKEGANIFVQVPQKIISFRRHRVPIDVDPSDHFVTSHALALGRQHGNFIAVRL
jgi:hypothetical protein